MFSAKPTIGQVVHAVFVLVLFEAGSKYCLVASSAAVNSYLVG